MSSHRHLRSKLAPVIKRYVMLKRALGRHFESESYYLARLDWFLASHKSDLTAASFSAWCSSFVHLTPSGRCQRMRIVYNLCLYRRRTEPDCFVPDRSQFPAAPPRLKPHIFTYDEIVRLLRTTEELAPNALSPLHRQAARLAIVLLYTTGLRRGEVVRLTLGDYNADERVLTVREAKFHKSRLVALSDDAVREMDCYLQHRRGPRFPSSGDSPLLLNNHGGLTAYTGPGFAMLIRKLFRRANIRTAAGRLPRVHDLRFTFAVHALVRWYREGADVQVRLPSLSIYMGHVSIASTQYYLSFLDDVGQAASERFDRHCSRFLPEFARIAQ